MGLQTYWKKRDFKKTAEPRGKRKKSKHGHSFVIQKHDASHLHYDFRLEVDGVLKSWAVPKGPSLDPSVKRLAMEVEDHPLDYANFEGEIPKGEYGGGEVIVWDSGSWDCEVDPRKALAKGSLEFELHGTKLHGKWRLVRTRSNGERAQWLLMKRNDSLAVPASRYDVTSEVESVLSGRVLECDAGDGSRPTVQQGLGKRVNSKYGRKLTGGAVLKASRKSPEKKSPRSASSAAGVSGSSSLSSRRSPRSPRSVSTGSTRSSSTATARSARSAGRMGRASTREKGSTGRTATRA